MSGLAIPASAARWTGTSGGPEAGPSDLLGCPDHRAAPFRGRLGPVPFSQMTLQTPPQRPRCPRISSLEK